MQSKIRIIPESIVLLKLTDEEYFNNYTDYMSNSRLSLINSDEGGDFSNFNSSFNTEYSDSFELGTAIHSMILQPDSYLISDFNKPSGKFGLFLFDVLKFRRLGFSILDSIKKASLSANYYASSFSEKRIKKAIKEGISFYLKLLKFEEHESKKTLFLSDTNKEKYLKCMSSLVSSEIFELVNPSEDTFGIIESFNEYAILCTLEVTIEGEIFLVDFKAKFDNFLIDHFNKTVTLNDLKSSSKPVKYFMGNYVKKDEESIWYNGSFQKYHYYRQVGIYIWLLQAALALKDIQYKPKVNMLVVETMPEFSSKIYPVNGKYIKAGLGEFNKLLTSFLIWKKQNYSI